MHRLIGSPPLDLPLGNWMELYDLTVALEPDLVLELGRGYGNSTCVFTEAANAVGFRVVSVGYDSEQAREGSAPLIEELTGVDWFAPPPPFSRRCYRLFQPRTRSSSTTSGRHASDTGSRPFTTRVPCGRSLRSCSRFGTTSMSAASTSRPGIAGSASLPGTGLEQSSGTLGSVAIGTASSGQVNIPRGQRRDS
jgi:hypothetical protein